MFTELNMIRIFCDNPEREFHLRELARLLKLNPVTVKRRLDVFVKTGILKRRHERNLEIYSSGSENYLYKEYKKIYNRLRIIESGIIDFIKIEFNLPTIVLFGSYSRGEDNKNSDIDIFILSEIKKDIDTSKFEKRLGRRMQIHLFNKKELERLKNTNKELVNNIINGWVMHGFLEVL